jgi:exosortase D (VPLPA-CTERM-specific)
MASDAPTNSFRSPYRTNAAVGLWVGLAVIGLLAGYALFGESLRRVVKEYAQPEFSHGYIIPLLSGWLIMQRRQWLWRLRDGGAAGGWWLVAGGVAVALFAHAANVTSLPYLALLPCLVGLVAASLGWRSARLVLLPVAFLVFGFPLPNTAYVLLSTELQLVSSQLGAGMLEFMGVPVLLDGNIIDLGTFKLQVAEACSGLRYLLPLVSFGVICAVLYRGPWWAKLGVVAATVPLTVLLNGFRIAVTGLFVEYGDPALAQGFMHFFEGWVVFLLALACLFALMWGLWRLAGNDAGMIDMLDFDRAAGTPGGVAPAGADTAEPPAAPGPSRAAIGAVVVLAVGALSLVPLELRPHVVPERPGLLSFPMRIADWRGEVDFIDTETRTILGADDYVLADYTESPGSAPVNLWVAYYDSLLRDGSHVHMPTSCLPGSGWEYVELGRHDTGLRDLSGQPLTVNRGVAVHGARRVVMYFWLELRGRHAIGQEARLRNLWDSFVTGRSDGALVRVYTPLNAEETARDGDARLRAFLAEAYPRLAPHVGP